VQASRRLIQIVRFFLLGSIVVYAGLAWRLPSNVDPNPLIFRVITMLSVSMVIIVFAIRRVRVLPVEQLLANQPADGKLLMRWRQGHLLTYVLSEAIALYGVSLHFLGNPLARVVPFFIAAFVLILFLRPKLPAREFPAGNLSR
jgi:hypothetical protein